MASVVGQLNLYAYCLNNPVMGVDPKGEFVVLLLVIAFISLGMLGSKLYLLISERDYAMGMVEKDVERYAMYRRAGLDPDDFSFNNKYYEEYQEYMENKGEGHKVMPYEDLIAELAKVEFGDDYTNLTNERIAQGAKNAMGFNYLNGFRNYMGSTRIFGGTSNNRVRSLY